MKKHIERHRNIIDFTLSSLWRRKGRNIALVTVYTAIVFILASVIFFTDAIKREASLVLQNSPEMIVQRMSGGRHELLPEKYAEKIRHIRGVQSVKTRLWGYYYDPIVGANYTLIASEDAMGDGKIAVGQGVSRTRLLYEGDAMEFRTFDGSIIDLNVAKILPQESELVSSDLVVVTPGDFRRLFGTPKDYSTDLALSVRNSKELATIAVKIAGLLPDTRQILREEILRTYDAVFSWRSGMMIVILTGSLLAFIIFAWDKASGLSMEEKKEIAILKAVGWETSDVIIMKFWEGIVISLSAFLAGAILAYCHIFFASGALFASALKGWSVLYPTFKIIPAIDFAQLAALFFLTVFPYTASTIVPSWRAAIADPDSVMKQ
jgi:ABC-type lipoprotein release transport system permease subunit